MNQLKDKYIIRHQQWLDKQKLEAPFPLKIRDLMMLWELKSTSPTYHTIKILLREGLVKTKKRSSVSTDYYAIEA